MQKTTALPLAVLLAATTLTACSSGDNNHADNLKIFATTGYLADAAANLAPEADITTMVGPGGDPHTYQPTTHDIEAMKDADLVLWSGDPLDVMQRALRVWIGGRQVMEYDLATARPVVASARPVED